MRDPFLWRKEGEYGLELDLDSSSSIRHEVLYEEDISSIADTAMRVGDPIPRRRFFLVQLTIGFLIALLVVRAGWIQVWEYDSHLARAEGNRLRTEILPARRGLIRDRNGVILAENTPSFDVLLLRRFLPLDPAEMGEVLGALGREIGMSIEDVQHDLDDADINEDHVLIQRDIPYEQAISIQILASTYPAIDVVVGHKRKYAYSNEFISLSHILGYVGLVNPKELAEHRAEGYRQVDGIGKTGIESSNESTLRGTPGARIFEVDSKHQITATVEERLPIDGEDLYLTLDFQLQKMAEESLKKVLANRNVKRGVAIALDPRDGSILAVVSLPAYDNNFFSGQVSSTEYARLIQDESHPLLPRAWAGTYPSGSTIKPVVAVAALEEGIVTPKTSVFSVGGIQIGPWFFPDWKAGGHGMTNVRFAIAWSVNTFFYYVGGGYQDFVGLGVDRLTSWFRAFGFGAQTGLDVPGELSGFVPSQQWKLETKGEGWFIGDTYNLSIGQGDLLVTPLQIARMTAEVANGGYAVTPHFVKSTGCGEQEAECLADGAQGDRIASELSVATVRQGMRETVVYGSGRALAGFPVPVSGKTGTAQWRADRENHAWFTAFAPFNDPEIVVTVLIEEGEEGSVTAVPVARDILWEWLRIRNQKETEAE
ncbi:MAG: penicillin-binding protein 2 [bacterium]|nr:penicillin-binding protein 2 [bacterium]